MQGKILILLIGVSW